MAKYIDAEKLAKAIEDKGLDCSFTLKMERLDTLALINSLQQEQPEVDIRKELDGLELMGSNDARDIQTIARHFYGLRNSALEEVARHVYESWMGGTLDDVRRDMVELGRVLNARKEENK